MFNIYTQGTIYNISLCLSVYKAAGGEEMFSIPWTQGSFVFMLLKPVSLQSVQRKRLTFIILEKGFLYLQSFIHATIYLTKNSKANIFFKCNKH